jgi:hypothetical protein
MFVPVSFILHRSFFVRHCAQEFGVSVSKIYRLVISAQQPSQNLAIVHSHTLLRIKAENKDPISTSVSEKLEVTSGEINSIFNKSIFS